MQLICAFVLTYDVAHMQEHGSEESQDNDDAGLDTGSYHQAPDVTLGIFFFLPIPHTHERF